jgi:hypothetical protein
MRPRRMERRKDLWLACWIAVIEMVEKVLRPYVLHLQVSQLTNFSEVQDAIQGLKVSKTPNVKAYRVGP